MKTERPAKTTSRRQMLTAAGVSALALAAITPGEAKADTLHPAVKAAIRRIRLLRRYRERFSRTLKLQPGRRIVLKNLGRNIKSARRYRRMARRF